MFALFAFSNVPRDLSKSAQASRPVPQRYNHNASPKAGAVFAHTPAFVLKSPSLYGNFQFISGLASFHILGRVKARKVLPNDLLRSVALDAFGPRIPTGNAAFRVQYQNCIIPYLRDQQAEQRFSLL